MNSPQSRKLLIVNPRGFCAGVERAIEVVERLLANHGSPLYVRREIVHNRAVVEDLLSRGVIFVEELDEVPNGERVVFSAHGVAPAIWADAEKRGLEVVDATCPLVTKVHSEVIHQVADGRELVLIGHAGHDEVLGTMGEAPGRISLVTSVDDVAKLEFPPDAQVAYVTQTTLSVDETAEIVAALRNRFSALVEPAKSDICYATQNRQDAVKALVQAGIDHLLVVGSQSSSNSRRLCEVAEKMGVSASLIDGPADLELSELIGKTVLGLTAGASAPEHLVQAVKELLDREGWPAQEIVTLQENVKFRLPTGLTDKK
jgi:4-hydroxy-3-methylbut-2-en-1-yl diphosphate reductase